MYLYKQNSSVAFPNISLPAAHHPPSPPSNIFITNTNNSTMKGFVSCIPLLAAAAQATPFTIHPRSTNCNKFGWMPCEFPGASVDTIECGTLAVPLDYTVNRPNETLSLDLQRIPATKSPKKGSILLNFGGPGADGSADLAAFGERMLA
jgi:hypothetical protein